MAKKISSWRVLATLSAAICAGELLIMSFLPHLHVENIVVLGFIDAFLLLLLTFPILYIFVLRSMLENQAGLELAISARTEDIENSNQQLKTTIEIVNEKQNRILALSEMGNLFQACRGLHEAIAVVTIKMAKLFPELSGSLFLINPSRTILRHEASWGDALQEVQNHRPEECWALRRSKPHIVTEAELPLACPHMKKGCQTWHVCLPLAAHGEAVGVLSLSSSNPARQAPGVEELEYLQTVSDNLAIAIANLQLQDRLRQQALRDPLTGLHNRRYLFDALDREIDSARLSRQPLSIAMLDVDHFKVFNDNFGHAAGDTVLASLGRVFREWARPRDLVTRFGGEEFAVVLPETTPAAAADRLEELRRRVSALKTRHDGAALGGITISAGVSSFPTDSVDRETLIKMADDALYHSKNRGRNRISLASNASPLEVVDLAAGVG